MVAIGVLMVAYWAFGPGIEIEPDTTVPADTGQRVVETEKQNADLGPGTARVLIHIAAIKGDTGSSYLLDALIEEVVQYGPSTPVLAAGSTISIDATDYFSGNEQVIKFKEGMSANCIISYIEVLTQTSATDISRPSGKWKLAAVSNE